MNSFINEVCVKWRKEIDSKILGEIKQKAIENGIKTEYLLNEKAIINALEKQIPKKPTNYAIDNNGYMIYECECPTCKTSHREYYPFAYCDHCGQAILWEGDTE